VTASGAVIVGREQVHSSRVEPGRQHVAAPLIAEVRFAGDSPLEGDGFEPSVPLAGYCGVFRERPCDQQKFRTCTRGPGFAGICFLAELARFLIGTPHQATKTEAAGTRSRWCLRLHRANGMPVRVGVGALLTVGTSSSLRSAADSGAEFRRWPFTH
jgi:hypothetical protein